MVERWKEVRTSAGLEGLQEAVMTKLKGGRWTFWLMSVWRVEVGTLKYPARLSVVVVALSDPCKNSLSRLSVSSIEELSMSLRSSSLEAEDPLLDAADETLLDAADETLLDAADETLLLSFRRKIFSRFSNSFLYLESVEGISPSSTSSGEIRNLLNNS